MPRFTLPLAIAVLVLSCLAPFSVAKASDAYRAFAHELLNTKPADVQFREDLEARLNARASGARVNNDREALAPSSLLKEAARAQALEMLLGGYVGHQSASGHSFEQRFLAFGNENILAFGENAARETSGGAVSDAKADRLFQQWLESAGHRRNLMNRDYDYVSTGVVQRGEHIYAVQIYWQKETPPQGFDALLSPGLDGGEPEDAFSSDR